MDILVVQTRSHARQSKESIRLAATLQINSCKPLVDAIISDSFNFDKVIHE